MIRSIIISLISVVVITIGLSVFLQPNDLSSCGASVGTASPCKEVDAIVAVSGGDTNARTDEAIKLYENGWSKELIFSGAAQDKSGPSNAAAMRARAIGAGVPATNINVEEYSATTKQNAENTQNIFSKQNIKTVILVTSGYHQKRASLEFNKRATGVTIFNHPVANDKDWSAWWWLTPHGWWLALSEFFKIIAFYVGISS